MTGVKSHPWSTIGVARNTPLIDNRCSSKYTLDRRWVYSKYTLDRRWVHSKYTIDRWWVFSKSHPWSTIGVVRNTPLIDDGCIRNTPLIDDGCIRNTPLIDDGCFRNTPLIDDGCIRNTPLIDDGCIRNSPLNDDGCIRNTPLIDDECIRKTLLIDDGCEIFKVHTNCAIRIPHLLVRSFVFRWKQVAVWVWAAWRRLATRGSTAPPSSSPSRFSCTSQDHPACGSRQTARIVRRVQSACCIPAGMIESRVCARRARRRCLLKKITTGWQRTNFVMNALISTDLWCSGWV